MTCGFALLWCRCSSPLAYWRKAGSRFNHLVKPRRSATLFVSHRNSLESVGRPSQESHWVWIRTGCCSPDDVFIAKWAVRQSKLIDLRIAIVGRRKSSMFEAKSDSVGIDLHVKIGGETGRGGTDRADKRGFCQFCRLPMILVGAGVAEDATFKNCHVDVSTATCDSHFEFSPAHFHAPKPTSGPNLQENQSEMPTVSQE